MAILLDLAFQFLGLLVETANREGHLAVVGLEGAELLLQALFRFFLLLDVLARLFYLTLQPLLVFFQICNLGIGLVQLRRQVGVLFSEPVHLLLDIAILLFEVLHLVLRLLKRPDLLFQNHYGGIQPLVLNFQIVAGLHLPQGIVCLPARVAFHRHRFRLL